MFMRRNLFIIIYYLVIIAKADFNNSTSNSVRNHILCREPNSEIAGDEVRI